MASFESLGLVVLLHVLFATMWVGGGLFQVLVIGPTLMKAGPAAGGFMAALARRGGMGPYFAIVGGLTILFGAGAYFQAGHHRTPFQLDGGSLWVTLGAILAVLAYLHGMLANMPTEKRWIAFVKDLKGPPTAEQQQQLMAFGQKMGKNGTVSVAMIALALILMLLRSVYF